MNNVRLKPCPFCGCEMEVIRTRCYKDTYLRPYGWHDYSCPLDWAEWVMSVSNGWTKEKVAEAWNKRA